MKKLLIPIAILLLISCTSKNRTPELSDRQKEQIVDSIKKRIVDPASYTSIEWTPVDTLNRSASTYPEYARLEKTIDSLEKLRHEITSRMFADNSNATYMDQSNRLDSISEKRKDVTERQSDWIKSMPFVQTGWWVRHKFKSNDSTGMVAFYQYDIDFDMGMNIIKIEDVTEQRKVIDKILEKNHN